MKPELLRLFPTLAGLPVALREELERHARDLRAPAGTLLFDAGAACQALPLLLEGHVKVSKRAENGREIRLYSVRPGELCIVTVSCLLGGEPYPASGIAENEVTAVALPRALILRLVAEHPPFRDMAFHLFAERLAGLMQLVEEVAFRKLDRRLAAWLLARAPNIAVSHQAIADELGSVREIVSRLLRQFEEQDWVRLGRERIEVRSPADLRCLADGN
ncbi:MAG: Crp/Fnr family transcriptional regulator [Thiobacillaceae bacterium]|jgi:CRP/FNR family transcriptional regulator|nr:Crp/Fnr family transcriptional regulator [Thiobacillaceae bacterium]